MVMGDTDATYRNKVFIVEDHPLVREGLRTRISAQRDMEVCGEATSVSDAIEGVRDHQPDVAIIDVSLEDSNGLELVKELSKRYKKTKIIVLTGFHENVYGERALRLGALGYVHKREAPEKILDAIRAVCVGQLYISADMTKKLLSKVAVGQQSINDDPVERLSDRELEVFRMIGNGQTTGSIARKLILSVHTIDTHREKLRHKLDLKNGCELTHRAVQWVLENGQ